jgi:Zn-dependent metalloprotease
MRAPWIGLAVAVVAAPAAAQQPVAAATEASVREWSGRVDRLLASRGLALRLAREDTMIAGRRHERLGQLYEGVPVFGGELVRQSDASGPLTVFGTLYEGIELDVAPRLRAQDAERAAAARGGHPFGTRGGPQLVVLPLDAGGYRLAYRVRAAFAPGFDLRQLFFDANTGELLLDYRDLQTQAAGLATGVLGDQKKISVTASGGAWQSADHLRPPLIATYDFRFNVNRFIAFLDSSGPPSTVFNPSDLGTDGDNVWTDGALVDAHVYAGYTYDYYFKRHGRHGLDDANVAIHSITHALRRDDWFLYPADVVFTFFTNAAYLGDGIMYYGDGLPPSVALGGQHFNYMSAGLDIVAHELSHGVTDYTSQLVYRDEPGALNEAFSDIMATGAEFYLQPDKADYLLGEDAITPGGTRSMQNPMAYGDPDHYSLLYRGPNDNGGVHSNSGIANHAFYLAIEGGRHRLGATVQGVGAANRAQIERVFYRAFTSFLTPSATFAQARAATIEAARELYGPGSAAETAVSQAWTAVGVN